MAKSKRKSVVSKPKPKAKRRKAQQKKRALPILTTDEKLQAINKHVNMCVARVNMLLQHTQFIQAKMSELANLTQRELNKFNLQIEDLQLDCEKTREDVYRLCPCFEANMTVPRTSLSIGGIEMSEEALIKSIGDFADTLP